MVAKRDRDSSMNGEIGESHGGERASLALRCSAIAAWTDAARIVLAISPNSASCERVFALLKTMFGDHQMSSLADYIQKQQP